MKTATKPIITLGSLWQTRNGCEARITAVDLDGVRPVGAQVFAPGESTPHTRYYTAKGFEEAVLTKGKKQPLNDYDLVKKLIA